MAEEFVLKQELATGKEAELKLELTPTPVEPDFAPVPDLKLELADPVPVSAVAATAPALEVAAPVAANVYVPSGVVPKTAAAFVGAAPAATAVAPEPVPLHAAAASAQSFGSYAAAAPAAPAAGTAPAQPNVQYASFQAANPGPGSYPSAPVQQFYLYPGATYPMTKDDRTMYQIAFILNILSCISVGVAIIPLAWMIPMTVISYRIYKGQRQNTTTFSVLELIFLNVISGILSLIANKN